MDDPAQSGAPDVTQQSAEASRDSVSPRAHCLAAGRLFQMVGLVMLLGSCGFWSASGLILAPAAEAAERWADYLSGPRAAVALLTIDIVATCVGGLGLIGAGMGLSNEKRSAGRVSLFVTGALVVVFLSSAMGFVLLVGAWAAATVAAGLGLVAGTLFLAAAHCASILKRFPPPKHSKVTEEYLEGYRRSRDERRRKYDI